MDIWRNRTLSLYRLGAEAALDGLSVTVPWAEDDQQRVTVGPSASLCLALETLVLTLFLSRGVAWCISGALTGP